MQEARQTLEERLAESLAVRSLRAEQQVAALLRKFRWSVDHGRFYTDPTTGKLREIDVVGRCLWHRDVRGRHNQGCLYLFCEVKSMRDFHLVFAPLAEGPRVEFPQYEWIGHHSKRLARSLDAANLEPTQTGQILKHFERASYTLREERARVHRMMINPPASPFASSAFRETNVGSDKELDNSVLWRAIQTVAGCVESARRKHLDDAFGSLELVIELARRMKRGLVEFITEESTSPTGDLSTGGLELYHPIVFVEARLWLSYPAQVREIDWCRFFLLGSGWPEMWCDVVSLRAAHAYLSRIIHFYSVAMRRLAKSR